MVSVEYGLVGTNLAKAILSAGEYLALQGNSSRKTLGNSNELLYEEKRWQEYAKKRVEEVGAAEAWKDVEERIKSDFLSLASLDDSVLQALADALEIPITIDGTTITVDVVEAPVVVGPTDPTPRTVPVTYEMEDFGTDMEQWEQAVADASNS